MSVATAPAVVEVEHNLVMEGLPTAVAPSSAPDQTAVETRPAPAAAPAAAPTASTPAGPPADGDAPTQPLGAGMDAAERAARVRHLLGTEAPKRWLKTPEVYEVLLHWSEQAWPLSRQTPAVPTSGSVCVYDRRTTRGFRKDGHTWRKKKDGRTVKETHERLKVDNVERVNCYYAHSEHLLFQRRCYWLLDGASAAAATAGAPEPRESIVLVHYLMVSQEALGPKHKAAQAAQKWKHKAQRAALPPAPPAQGLAPQRRQASSRRKFGAMRSGSEPLPQLPPYPGRHIEGLAVGRSGPVPPSSLAPTPPSVSTQQVLFHSEAHAHGMPPVSSQQHLMMQHAHAHAQLQHAQHHYDYEHYAYQQQHAIAYHQAYQQQQLLQQEQQQQQHAHVGLQHAYEAPSAAQQQDTAIAPAAPGEPPQGVHVGAAAVVNAGKLAAAAQAASNAPTVKAPAMFDGAGGARAIGADGFEYPPDPFTSGDVEFFLNMIEVPTAASPALSPNHAIELDMAAAEAAMAHAFADHAPEQPLDAAPIVAEAASAAAAARVMAAPAENFLAPEEIDSLQPSSAPEADREGGSESESGATDTNKLPLPLPPPGQRAHHGGRSASRSRGLMLHMREREVWQQSRLVIDLLAAMQAAITEEPDWSAATSKAKAFIAELVDGAPPAPRRPPSELADAAMAATRSKIDSVNEELQELLERLVELSAPGSDAAERNLMAQKVASLKVVKEKLRSELADYPRKGTAVAGEQSSGCSGEASGAPGWMRESDGAPSSLHPAMACRALQLKLIDCILESGFEPTVVVPEVRARLNLLNESVLSATIHGLLRRWQERVSAQETRAAEEAAATTAPGEDAAMPPRMSEVARRLFEHRGRDGAGALHLASALGDDAAIAAMLRAGAKVDGIDSRGCSPLHWAAAYGREEALALLLAAGADPGQVIDEAAGTTPADLAAAQGHGGIAAYLAEAALNQSLGSLDLSRVRKNSAPRVPGNGAHAAIIDNGGKSDANEQYYAARRRPAQLVRKHSRSSATGAGSPDNPSKGVAAAGEGNEWWAQGGAGGDVPLTRKRGRGRVTDESASGTDNNGGISRGVRAAVAVAGIRAAPALRDTDIESEVEARNAAEAAEAAAQTIQSAFRLHRQRHKRRPRAPGGSTSQGVDKGAYSDGDGGAPLEEPQAAMRIQTAYRLHRRRRHGRRGHSSGGGSSGILGAGSDMGAEELGSGAASDMQAAAENAAQTAAAAAAIAARAYSNSSAARLAVLDRAVTRVQAIVRSRQARTQYLRLRGAVLQLQTALRQRKGKDLQKRRRVVQAEEE